MVYALIYGYRSLIGLLNSVLSTDVPSVYMGDHKGEQCHTPVEMLPRILPLITAIISKSMTESVMPSSPKQATIMPLLKRSELEKKDMKNYQPISKLCFVSKLVEKVKKSTCKILTCMTL